MAAVVARAGHTVRPDDVIARSSSQLAGYKKPTQVFVVDGLLRNASLKVQKAVLRERLIADR